jgi:hypothetical protein
MLTTAEDTISAMRTGGELLRGLPGLASAVANLTKSIAPVAKALSCIPRLGAIVSGATTAAESGYYALRKQWKKATGSLIAGTAETVCAALIPIPGASDVGRTLGNKFAKAVLGKNNGGADAVSEKIFDHIVDIFRHKPSAPAAFACA